ncbi:tagatose 1,6-diphosphate aldolase 1 [Enterococcus sp. AZ135]|uniref:tagatose-bisphosphate aldolase n=1 Tax=unclassified Enterococcus TaxID=2608891 RepID=UPI003F2412C5
MKTISAGKKNYLNQITNEEGIIGALAIDQRGALKKMIGKYKEATTADVIKFKELVSQQLTPYASAILLDPEYGLPAAGVRDKDCGLLLAYEKTGYDATTPGRLPDVLNDWSVKRLKEAGADACKFLLYYDVDEPKEINEQKQAYMERIGSECTAEDIPFFLEIVSYDAEITDATSVDYAKVKPRKVIEAMREFSKDRYQVDVLKVEVPVNMNFVEGYGQEILCSQAEAAAYFKEQSEATELPFIFLSAGVSAELFQETLRFAKQSGSTFNGVLCGRATWANGVESFVTEGEEQAMAWLSEEGKRNIEELNAVLKETATSVYTNV